MPGFLVPVALAVLQEDFTDHERAEIRERHVAFSHPSGYALSACDSREREADDGDRLMGRVGDRPAGLLPHFLKTLAGKKESLDDRRLDAGDAKAMVGRGERTGRNDPCPCGISKKFKADLVAGTFVWLMDGGRRQRWRFCANSQAYIPGSS